MCKRPLKLYSQLLDVFCHHRGGQSRHHEKGEVQCKLDGIDPKESEAVRKVAHLSREHMGTVLQSFTRGKASTAVWRRPTSSG